MSVIIRIPNITFSGAGLPKLSRDSIITSGTKLLYDSVDSYSYAKQANPSNGSPSADTWVNLVEGGAAASIYSPNGDITFNKGFIPSGTPFNKVVLNGGAIPATPTKALAIVWVKHLAQTATTNSQILINLSGIVGIFWTPVVTTNAAANSFVGFTNGSAQRQFPSLTPAVGSIYQLGIAYDNAGFAQTLYVNGALAGTFSGYQNIQAPGAAPQLMAAAGYSSVYLGNYYRALYDDLSSGVTPLSIVAADYAANSARFS
jgi:hypothetical protein